ncbi:MAG: TIGR01440 family protein [Clostridia bacterium]|nr:TIGR01440 family protein [Clostridia bacterium]NCC68529.1 TIGR01440 family protein [Clostridia bacterium]
MYEEITTQAAAAMTELLSFASPTKGSIVVIGCSSSEIVGERIGKGSAPEAARAVIDGVMPVLEECGLYLAAQCCEHLNRALIIEREAMEKFGYEQVLVRPRPKAGGSFATAAYEYMKDPVAVEHVRAAAGLDIGCTLIGMHLRDVAVPLRLGVKMIGMAQLSAARTRPKLIGGERAEYPENI